ncbi:MAG: hypothetical protein R6X33_13445 [Candidatus Brocadiia bacterium]
MIQAECPNCGWSKEIQEAAEGKRARCPKCGEVFVLRATETDAGEIAPDAGEVDAYSADGEISLWERARRSLSKLRGRGVYEVQCARCEEPLKITREEVEADCYTCPVCNHTNLIPAPVRGQYQQERAEEDLRQREKERKKKERAARRAEKEKERKERNLAKQRARKEQLERSRRAEAERRSALRAGKCPVCGGEIQVIQKGYSTDTGLACCCLTGPIGLLGGFLGSGQKVRVCSGCGKEFSFCSNHKSAVTLAAFVAGALVPLFLVGSC